MKEIIVQDCSSEEGSENYELWRSRKRCLKVQLALANEDTEKSTKIPHS